MTLLDILDPNKNGLKAAPPEYKFMISIIREESGVKSFI